jgi:hypothetical protein
VQRIGQALNLTPEQLDLAAEVTPFDVVQARVLWLQHAPAVLMALLDAVAENGGADAEQA